MHFRLRVQPITSFPPAPYLHTTHARWFTQSCSQQNEIFWCQWSHSLFCSTTLKTDLTPPLANSTCSFWLPFQYCGSSAHHSLKEPLRGYVCVLLCVLINANMAQVRGQSVGAGQGCRRSKAMVGSEKSSRKCGENHKMWRSFCHSDARRKRSLERVDSQVSESYNFIVGDL